MVVADSSYGLGGEVDGEGSDVMLADTAGSEVGIRAGPGHVGEVSRNIAEEVFRVLEQGGGVGGMESYFHPVLVENLGRDLFEFRDKLTDICLLRQR